MKRNTNNQVVDKVDMHYISIYVQYECYVEF